MKSLLLIIISALMITFNGIQSEAKLLKKKIWEVGDGKVIVNLIVAKGVRQRSLVLVPEIAKAAVIMFTGYDGRLGIKKRGKISKPNKVVVKARKFFRNQGMIVALYDIRSDKDEMFGNRDEYWHVEDIGKLITHLKETYNVPVWLMGHGHGVKSVASAGAAFTNRIGGVVFSGAGDEVSHRSVEKITVPALVVHHKNSDCRAADPESAVHLHKILKSSKKAKLMMFEGGDEGRADCSTDTHHGYLGIRKKVFKAITDFIKSNH